MVALARPGTKSPEHLHKVPIVKTTASAGKLQLEPPEQEMTGQRLTFTKNSEHDQRIEIEEIGNDDV